MRLMLAPFNSTEAAAAAAAAAAPVTGGGVNDIHLSRMKNSRREWNCSALKVAIE